VGGLGLGTGAVGSYSSLAAQCVPTHHQTPSFHPVTALRNRRIFLITGTDTNRILASNMPPPLTLYRALFDHSLRSYPWHNYRYVSVYVWLEGMKGVHWKWP
jgi:hypothetical protein